jgi:hypothetical protein
MASIHISEIKKILASRGEADAKGGPGEGFFLEIRFDGPPRKTNLVDKDLKNKVITAECSYGSVTIQFDEKGELKSLDLS